MTTRVRRAALFGTLLAVALAVFSARSDARDSPVIDTKKNACQVNFNMEFVRQLPTDRNVLELLNLAPGVDAPQQATVTVQQDARGRVNDFYVDGVRTDGQTTRFDFNNIGYNSSGCWFKGLTARTDFGDGYSGKIQMEVRTRPNLRMFWNLKDLRGPGGPIKKDKVFFFLPSSTTAGQPRTEQPPDPGTPGVPVPSDPGAPAVPAPGHDTPAFTAWQPRIGLSIRDRGRISGSFQKKEHSAEEHARHTINSVALCDVLSGGNTTVEVFNVTASGFGYRGVGGSIPNLSFGNGYCNVDRCETQGTFFDQPVRKSLDRWRASGTDLLADTSVFFNQSQFRLDYSGRYFPPGSTETILPPVVPYVPPPPPPGGFLIYAGGPTLQEGTRLNFEMSVLPHNTHEAHAVDWQGQRVYLCQKGVGVSEAVIRNIRAPNMFDLVRTAPPRPGFHWSTFNCQRVDLGGPIACNGKGSFYGQDVLARGTTLIQPGSTSAEGTLDVEFVQTKSIVPFDLKYSF